MFTPQWLIFSATCLAAVYLYFRMVMPEGFFDDYWDHVHERRLMAYYIMQERGAGERFILFIMYAFGMLPIGTIWFMIAMIVEAIKK